MGTDKGSILKAKYIDVKKISAQIDEEDLKSKFKKDKDKRKINHRRFESLGKVEIDMKKKFSGFIDDTKYGSSSQNEIEKIHEKVIFLN